MQSMSDGLWRKKIVSTREESSYPNSVPARLSPSPKASRVNGDCNSDSL